MNNRIDGTIREDGVIISTVEVMFWYWFGKYETAITFDNQNTWRIAEGYETEEQAREGHNKYSNMSIEELKKIEWIG